MRSLLVTGLLLLSFAAWGQSEPAAGAPTAQPSDAPESARAPAAPRAPLAAVEDIGPAVDTSRAFRAPPQPPSPASASVPRQTAAAAGAPVIDTLDLGTTSITGNQELPKVLYIVPWKRSDLGDLVGRPVNTLLDEVLAPVDPEVFERHLAYYETLYGESQEE